LGTFAECDGAGGHTSLFGHMITYPIIHGNTQFLLISPPLPEAEVYNM